MAVRCVKARQMSINSAAKLYEVPKATLWQYVRGKYKSFDTRKKPTKKHLTESEEQAVVELASVLSQAGKPMRREDVMSFALVSTCKNGCNLIHPNCNFVSQIVRYNR